jgi:hypothetical protein
MIHIAESEDPPRRQLLGSDAYAIVRDELTERLRALEDSAASHCPPTARGDEPARVIAQDPVSAPVVVCALERGLEMSLPWRTNR